MNIIGVLLGWFVSGFGAFLAVIPHAGFLVFVKGLGFLMCLLDNKRRYNDALTNLHFIYGDSLTLAQKKIHYQALLSEFCICDFREY